MNVVLLFVGAGRSAHNVQMPSIRFCLDGDPIPHTDSFLLG